MRWMRQQDLLLPTPAGLCCKLGGFHIDPIRPVARALITHGHGDHARAGNERVLANLGTVALMQARYGELGGGAARSLPAGHVLGSAQIVLDYRGSRVVVSGDYKRRPDPTCEPFEPCNCDL